MSNLKFNRLYHMKQGEIQNIQQIQRLILSPQMQQALNLLQLPILEISSIVEEELTQNPILEKEDEPTEETPAINLKYNNIKKTDLKSAIENFVPYEISLYDHLVSQAREACNSENDFLVAQQIIGFLDPDGILRHKTEELASFCRVDNEQILKIVSIIQTLDPPGVGSCNQKESFLIQLTHKNKKNSLAFNIVEKHYDDLLHNRIPVIAKSLGSTSEEVNKIIKKEIACLDLQPGNKFPNGHCRQVVQTISPDLIILHEDGRFAITVNDYHLPHIRLNQYYMDMLNQAALQKDVREYIKEKISSGRWLMRNLCERHDTLYHIGEDLVKRQSSFLSTPAGGLVPCTMKELSIELGLHESTVARAIANKYVSCPRGILPLRSFFTHAYSTNNGDIISADSVKNLLRQIVDKEDKKTPFSDEKISRLIEKSGIPCARRTIAKYRKELKIGARSQRRNY